MKRSPASLSPARRREFPMTSAFVVTVALFIGAACSSAELPQGRRHSIETLEQTAARLVDAVRAPQCEATQASAFVPVDCSQLTQLCAVKSAFANHGIDVFTAPWNSLSSAPGECQVASNHIESTKAQLASCRYPAAASPAPPDCRDEERRLAAALSRELAVRCSAGQLFRSAVADSGTAMLSGHRELDRKMPGLLEKLPPDSSAPWVFAPRTQSYKALVAERIRVADQASKGNLAAVERVARIDRALAAMRSALAPWDHSFILVQVPQGFVEYYHNGKFVRQYRAVVGAWQPVYDPDIEEKYALNRTLPVDSHIRSIVFNPAWVVPARIALNELAPKIAKDPRYLKRNGFTSYAYPGEGKTVYTQAPGPENALGRVKFQFPNDMGYYLHGSPRSKQHLLNREDRLLSHGCVRVKDALKLAARVLTADQGLTWDGIRLLLKDWETRTVPLKTPLAVHVIYSTIAADSHGKLYDFEDFYKLEESRPGRGGAPGGGNSAPRPLPGLKRKPGCPLSARGKSEYPGGATTSWVPFSWGLPSSGLPSSESPAHPPAFSTQ